MTYGQDEVCAHCGADIPFEDIVWADPETGDIELDGEGADPYHEECLP